MNMKPSPPPTLSKEYSRVWIGWCMIGDREVAREAAAKGIYIDLALQFIATRKEWDHSDVERWFKSEIFTWVYQLIEHKQIFKASHILLNIARDPKEHLSIIISETTNKNIRDYIGEHLLKNGNLETHILNYWKLILAIEKSSHVWDDTSQISIQKVEQKSTEWKSNIAAILFFDTFDFHLESFLTPESSWEHLLNSEKLEILKLWINIFFSKNLNYNCKTNLTQDNYEKLKNIFLVWEITIDMINKINTKNYQLREFVKIELSNYGIFTDDEKCDVPIILSRLCKKQNIENIFNILQEPSSCININDFYDKLNSFSIVNELYEILSICPTEFNISPLLINKTNKKKLDLWLRKKDFRDIKITDEVLLKHIIIALNYFDNDINLYLKNNPIILIAIILFTKDIHFTNIINKTDLIIDNNIKINSELIINYLNQLPAFKVILTKYISIIPEDHNIYELIKKQTNLSNVLDFRSNFGEIPNFNNKSMSEKYCLSENLNYFYYIKQCRPSIAVKLFVLNQFKKYGRIEEHEFKNTKNKILKLVLSNNTTSEILSSCIAFLEMIGISTNDLRILISSINLIKSSEKYKNENINFENNSSKILNILENILLSKYNIKENNFINTIKNFELVINFAKMNNLNLPEKFLIDCAKNNLWLQFLIFIQKYNYPLEQVLKLTLHFQNKEIFEHIHHAISTEIESNMEISFTHCEPKASENNSDFSVKSNLLKILIKCHKSEDPPTALLQACQVYRYPLLAILAACYEPDSVVINWLIWLSISTNVNIFKVENCSVNPNAVSNFLENVLSKKYVRTLLESLEIFISENPLYLLVQFLYNAVQSKFNSCIEYLKQFEKSINHLNFNTVLINNDFEYTYLNNSYWLINTALKLIFATLGNCFVSKENQITFLNILCTAEFAKNVPVEYPNFCAISQLLQTISTNIEIDLSVFLDLDKRREEIIRCVEELINKKKFKDAIEFTKYENICKEYVLNEKWTDKFHQQPSSDFLIKSDFEFKSADISACSAAEFYVYCCMNYTENYDKYKALNYGYSWLKKSNYSDRYIENVEHDIWLNYFALDDDTLKKSHYDKHDTNYLLSEIKQRINTSTQFDNELNKIQIRHFEETVGKLLEVGDIIEALRLEKMFNQKHPETDILLTCYELAEGNLKPYEISAEQRLLFLNRDKNLKSVPHRRRTVNKSNRTTSSGSYDSIQTVFPPITENEESNPQDTLTLLETLTDRLKHGSDIGSRILMCYRISVNINVPYQEVVKHTDSKNLLKTALENDCKNKVEVVHDIFVIYKWNKLDITEFILEELQKAIQHSVNLNLDSVYMWDLELDSQFHLVLQLCSETNSILGKKLILIISAIQKSQINSKNIDLNEMNMIVELLVRAHDCFNAYCNMEGISSVLRKSQTLTSILLTLKQWKLMVRLLTGIGKYTEMNYIFQILKENDQFEYLLKRNYRQNNALKVALLKYLKKHCPKNQDLYRIVALHFTLFSEVAELWENEANEMINNLIEIAKLEVQNQKRNFDLQIVLFCNNESTKLCLHKVMDNFSHAAEYHLHGDKLVSAMKTAKQAELVALQISLLNNIPNSSSTNCILKLASKEILEMISSSLSFAQSKILVEAYNYQVDWGTVLYKQCIQNGKIDYLEEYLTSKPLTNTLVQDLTRRFLAERNLAPISVKSMKDILKRLDSVHMKYRLASELGFGDVIESILNGTQLAYLKDTVWKKGYKQL